MAPLGTITRHSGARIDNSCFGAGASILPASEPTTSSPPEKSIAVLPFADLSEAKDQEYFCDGISEEILDGLARVDGLRVVGRTSSFSFKGENANVSEVGKKLNVASVLEGTLRCEGNRVRITAELVNTRNGFHLWSETYERELQGVFAVQDEITRSIVEALKVKLAVSLPVHEQRNTEAYELYLQGLFFSNKSSEADLRRALNFFQSCSRKRSDIFACLGWDLEGLVFSGRRLRKTTRSLPSIKRSSFEGDCAGRGRC